MDAEGQLQALIDHYETQAMMWDWRADEVEAHAPPEGWSAELVAAIVEYRHRAETRRELAQEVRDSNT